jgi:ABC-2 type transport system ATP-binding protein
MIEAVGLHKSFGETHALRGIDLDVAEGTILAVLGPNGAGKTTAVRILTTLTHPDSGGASVAGVDVLRHPGEARQHSAARWRETARPSLASQAIS